MKRKFLTFACIAVCLFTGSMFVVPATPVYGQCESGKLCNPLKADSVQGLIEYLLQDILVKLIVPVVVTAMLIYSGFKFVVAQGNEEKLRTARTNFLYVIVGSVILLGAYVIYEIVINTVNEFTV